MTAAGLLTLALCASPGGTPSAPASPYNVTAVQSKPVSLPGDVRGRATIVDVAGRVSLADGEVIGATAATALAVGAVYEPAYTRDPDLCGPTADYVPQVGDIVLTVSDHPIWQLLFAIALSHEPCHAAIVVRTPCGGLGLLEAGPPDVSPHVQITPLAERLASDSGRVYIRRRCTPLTAEQADALNGFAERQEGKFYAYLRFLCQGTPFRCRGPMPKGPSDSPRHAFWTA